MTTKTKTGLVTALSLLVIAGSAYSLFLRGSRPDSGFAFHQHVGGILGEETAALLGNQGRVVVITLDPRRFPIFRAQLAGLKRALRSHGRVRLTRTIVIRPGGEAVFGLGRGLSAAVFLRIVDEHRNVNAIVSLVGVPNLKSAQIRRLKQAKPVFVVEAKFGARLRKLLDRHVVQVAVVPRVLPPPAGLRRRGDAWRDRFDLYFQVLKPPPQPVVALQHSRPSR